MKMPYFFLLVLLYSTAFASEQLTILGSGPAGLTAAIYAGQAGLSPLVIEGMSEDGQLSSAPWIENFPGFADGISGDELIEKMHFQAEKFGTHFKTGEIIHVDLSERPYAITTSEGETIYTEALIIAIGTSKRWLGLESEESLKGKGVFGSTKNATQYSGKQVVVLGGAESALEEALILAQESAQVTVIHRGEKLNASPYLLDKIAASDNIQVLFNMAVEDILDVTQERVTGIALRHLKTDESLHLSCEAIFVSLGRSPRSDLFKEQLELKPTGHLSLSGTKTSVPGVFAAGDAHDAQYRKAITAAGFGCMAALDAIQFLNNKFETHL